MFFSFYWFDKVKLFSPTIIIKTKITKINPCLFFFSTSLFNLFFNKRVFLKIKISIFSICIIRRYFYVLLLWVTNVIIFICGFNEIIGNPFFCFFTYFARNLIDVLIGKKTTKFLRSAPSMKKSLSIFRYVFKTNFFINRKSIGLRPYNAVNWASCSELK